MAQPRALGLNKVNVSNGQTNVRLASSPQNAYELPIQLIELTEDLTTTLTIPNQANHAYTVVDTGTFNISTNGSACIDFQDAVPSHGLILRGSGLLTTGGTIENTVTITGTGTVDGVTITRQTGPLQSGPLSTTVTCGNFVSRNTTRFVVGADTSIMTTGLGTPDADGGSATARGTMTIVGTQINNNGTTTAINTTFNTLCFDSTGNGGGCATQNFRGPAWQSGDGTPLQGSAGFQNATRFAAGTVITYSNLNTNQGASVCAYTRAQLQTYNYVATNSNPFPITVGGQVIQPNETVTISSQTQQTSVTFTTSRPANLVGTYTFSGTGDHTESNAGGISGVSLRRDDRTIAAHTGTGTGTGSSGGIGVTQTSTTGPSGALGNGVNRGAAYTVAAGDAIVSGFGPYQGDSGTGNTRITVTIRRGNSTIYNQTVTGFSGANAVIDFRGPAYQSGDPFVFVGTNPVLQAGDVISVSPITYFQAYVITRSRSVVTRYNNIYLNNNTYTVTLNTGTTGLTSNAILNPGQSVAVTNQTSSSWTVATNAIPIYDYFATNNGPADVTLSGAYAGAIQNNNTEVVLLSNQSANNLSFTITSPAINADGDPLSPGAESIIGPSITRTANGTVTAGVDFSGFTGQYSRIS